MQPRLTSNLCMNCHTGRKTWTILKETNTTAKLWKSIEIKKIWRNHEIIVVVNKSWTIFNDVWYHRTSIIYFINFHIWMSITTISTSTPALLKPSICDLHLTHFLRNAGQNILMANVVSGRFLWTFAHWHQNLSSFCQAPGFKLNCLMRSNFPDKWKVFHLHEYID